MIIIIGGGSDGSWGAVENRGVENGGNDRTEGAYRVKRGGSGGARVI